jgi:transposase
MRLSIRPSGSKEFFYVLGNITKNGKSTSVIIEKLGTADDIIKKYHCEDPEAWARKHVEELNLEKKEQKHRVLVPFSTNSVVPLNQQNSINIGYLFLQQIYYRLGIPYICRKISERHGFEYDMDSILSRLVYGRILFPSSKLSCYEQSSDLYEKPCFDLHQIYRALSVIAEESGFIQSQLYRRSGNVVERQTGVLYYDCTNYFFETEEEEGLKKYGPSKEHRPTPIVQMGLFMDHSGIPLAFSIHEGNNSEQNTLTPLEQQIISDFGISKFIVCTDAGLSSDDNRKFNNFGSRCFITTQSVKKLDKRLKAWALSPEGWSLEGSSKAFDLRKIEDTPENRKLIFYKQQLIEGYDEENDIEFNQNLIVTFSLKYKAYQKQVRLQQISRAQKLMENPGAIGKTGPNDRKRFIKKTSITRDGEIAKKDIYELNEDRIREEEQYDGFYAVCTNLDDDPADIAKINRGRWEIEESFQILKSELEARPVYLKRDDRIQAHFMTCFIALLIYRILEKQLGEHFTCEEIIDTLRGMRMAKVGKEGFIPAYKRTALTDALHDNAGFRTDYELSTDKSMKGFCRRTKGL